MRNILYYARLYYYGDDKNCLECIMKTYLQYYDEKNEIKNFYSKRYCSNHQFLDTKQP